MQQSRNTLFVQLEGVKSFFIKSDFLYLLIFHVTIKSVAIYMRKFQMHKGEKTELDISFNDDCNLEHSFSKIFSLKSPNIVLWYIGAKGLRVSCAKFYKENIIDHVLENNPSAVFWLVDLTAWGALKDKNSSICNFSSISNIIDNFNQPRIKCLKSSEFFNKIKLITDKEVISHFQSSLSDPHVWSSSADFDDNDISVGDLFQNDCQLLSNFYDRNASKSYSMLQYLEGCFLVEEISKRVYLEKNNRDIEIVFFLPNNERKYYQHAQDHFASDIQFAVKNSLGKFSRELKISINFFSFKYGENEHCRPYNAKGKNFRKNQFILQYITSMNQDEKK